MSEIYPSVRTSIRNSVLQALYQRPGAWLSTHDLLGLVEEAETSGILARILSDMAATGRLAKGPKTQNANGQACNTWGLSPEWRGRMAVENTRQDHINLGLADSLIALDAALEECATHLAAERQTTMASLTPPVAILGTEPQPLPPESYEDGAARLPASIAPPDPAPPLPAESREDERPYAPISAPDQPRPDWDIAAVIADYSDHKPLPPTAQEAATDIHIHCHPLPERWLPELRLRLMAIDGGADPEIILRVTTEGGCAYLTLSTRGKIAFDPGELDFLPSIGTALCQFVDALYPYGATRPIADATTPPAHRKPSHESLHP
jgi:hypothetical protein